MRRAGRGALRAAPPDPVSAPISGSRRGFHRPIAPVRPRGSTILSPKQEIFSKSVTATPSSRKQQYSQKQPCSEADCYGAPTVIKFARPKMSQLTKEHPMKPMCRNLSLLGLLAFAIVCMALPAAAQDTAAQLAGTVQDASGGGVPHAHLTIANQDTNLTKQTDSDGTGAYVFRELPPGPYTLSVSMSGFQSFVEKGIQLTVEQHATLPVSLKVGSNSETVTVAGGAELINATTAEISQVIGQDEVSELPLNGRDPSTLVNLSAGTTNELFSQASTLTGSNSFSTENGASVGGQRQGSAWYLLDGVANMDTYDLLASPFPDTDATQEFRVVTNNFDAQYGFAPMAIVSIQTRSGTNQFHGGAFEFIRNDDGNAANWFTGKVNLLKQNQFGGYVGGPILRDKLFFFANYQGTRISTNSASNPTYTPTQAMLNGDFSAVSPSDLNGPLAGVFQTVNGKPQQVNPSLFSKGALAIAQSLPLGQDPATGLTNYVSPAEKQNWNQLTSRLDYKLASNQQVFARAFLNTESLPGTTTVGDI